MLNRKTIKIKKDIKANSFKLTETIKVMEGIYINNAGLVIIADFLPLLFKKLLLIENGKIVNISKAVYLVQYLASGNESFAEFELALAKILCGSDLQLPIDPAIHFGKKEKKEINKLLLSVIEFWKVLKGTSIDGFRESFLMRKGKLWLENNEWHLRVEQTSFDILLQQLPWNINIIRLPCMRYPLRTEWAY